VLDTFATVSGGVEGAGKGASVTEVARRFGASRQSVHFWTAPPVQCDGYRPRCTRSFRRCCRLRRWAGWNDDSHTWLLTPRETRPTGFVVTSLVSRRLVGRLLYSPPRSQSCSGGCQTRSS